MIVDVPACSATVGAYALAPAGGTVSLDTTRAPHVTATLEIAYPAVAAWAALDPRTTPRVTVTSGGRTFDLGVRDRTTDRRAARVTLVLASDEALLNDYAPLANDDAAFSRQTSLRSVVAYVLGKAIPGAVLAVTPGVDADVSVYSDSTNLITDPSNEGAGTIYAGSSVSLDKADTSWAAVGSKSVNLYNPTNNGAFMSVGGDTGAMRNGMVAGKTYMLSATGRVKMALTGAAGANARQLVVYYRDGVGGYPSIQSPQIVNTVGTATRVSMIFTLPATATEAFVRAYHGYTGGEVQWDAFRLSEYTGDPTDTGYFDGSMAATAAYVYGWQAGAHASIATRRALISRHPESLLWKAGVSALDFLQPLVQARGLRLVCDEQRVWTLRDENYTADGGLSLRQGVNLGEAAEVISRDAGIWTDARVTCYRWTDLDGNVQERIDAYALTPTYSRLTRLDLDAAYPGPGRSEYAVRRAQGVGREVTVTCQADWTARAEAALSIVLEDTPAQLGKVQSVTFDIGGNTMTVTARTTDIQAGAIDLLTGTVDALTGTVNAL